MNLWHIITYKHFIVALFSPVNTVLILKVTANFAAFAFLQVYHQTVLIYKIFCCKESPTKWMSSPFWVGCKILSLSFTDIEYAFHYGACSDIKRRVRLHLCQWNHQLFGSLHMTLSVSCKCLHAALNVFQILWSLKRDLDFIVLLSYKHVYSV